MISQQHIPIETAGVFIIKQGKVLLVKHTATAKQPTDFYGFPAGRLEDDETLAECASRELEEETGYRAPVESLVLIHRNENVELPMSGGTTTTFNFSLFRTDTFTGKLTRNEDNIPEWVSIDMIDKISCIGNTAELISVYAKEAT